MDPTTGLPLHIAVEAVGLTVAGVLVVWATIVRRPAAAIGSIALVVAQVAYAGGFADDEVWVSVLRIVSVATVVAGGWVEPPLLGFGAAAVAGASVWRLAAEGNAAVLGAGPRVVLLVGFAVLAVWAARRATVLVRTRIAAAFLGVLGVAIVVAGSTAARVGVANAIDRAQSATSDAALSEQRHLAERAQALASRAALASAVLTELGPNPAALAQLRVSAFSDADVFLYVDRDGQTVVEMVEPTELGALLSSPAVAAAHAGDSVTAVAPAGSDVLLFGAAPVFGPGGGRSPADVVGALVAGDRLAGTELVPRGPAGPRPAVQVVAADGTALRSSGAAPNISIEAMGGGSFRTGRLQVGGDDFVVTLAEVPLSAPPRTAVVASSPIVEAADVADAFPRGLVGGVLAAALLAVVIALWLSARITRPILNLADEAERVKTEFLSTISHELRTPLTPIRGYADLLRRGRVPRRRAEAYLDEIDDAARRLERIVTLLVEVAAIQAGRFTVEREPVHVDKLLAAVAARWRRRSRHDFKVRVPKSLPRVNADPEAIATVLDELLDNAVKFSPEGGTVELRAQRGNEGVEISVSDEGIGMEAEEVERLSSAFVQAEPGETRRFGGLGLGLTYAAGVLASHGSRLRVEAVPAGGSTFSFVLPPAGMVSRMRDRARAR